MRRGRLPPPLPEPVLRLEGRHRRRRLRVERGIGWGREERRGRRFVGVQGLHGGRGRFGLGVPLVCFVLCFGPVFTGLQSLLRGEGKDFWFAGFGVC